MARVISRSQITKDFVLYAKEIGFFFPSEGEGNQMKNFKQGRDRIKFAF